MPATRVLIRTFIGDGHAAAVAAQLRRSGISCDLWYTGLFPGRQRCAFASDQRRTSFRVTDGGLDADMADYDCVWHRRPTPPESDHIDVHEEDRDYAASQAQIFYRMSNALFGAGARLWPGIRQVNDPLAAFNAESKLLQIAAARRAGLAVPDTLVSNCPDAIRAFVAARGSVVCKSLYPYSWDEGEGGAYANLSARFHADALPGDAALGAVAEIFQTEIVRKREIRLFLAGPYEFAVEICPGADARGEVDWRIFHHSRQSTRALATVDPELSRSCRGLLDQLGIVTASIDLLESEDGQVYFSDLNQAGQFLWMEQFGLPVLDAFCRFLSEDDNGCDRPLQTVGLEAIHSTEEFIKLQDKETHLSAPPAELVGTG